MWSPFADRPAGTVPVRGNGYRRGMPLDTTGLPLLGSGREADVYALDDGRVLRRYRTGADTGHEAAVMAHVAAHGYPVPAVYAADGPDLVLERLDGPTMARVLLAGELDPVVAARMLADLHRDLHVLPPPPGADPARGSGDTVLHLDLHPENVLLTGRGPVVIDWHNAGAGPAAYDLAVSAMILAELAVGTDPVLRPVGRGFLTLFLEALGVGGGDPLDGLDRALAQRRADPGLSAAEVSRLGDAADVVRAVVAEVTRATAGKIITVAPVGGGGGTDDALRSDHPA